MSDWNLPSLTQTWANFVAAIKGRDESNAKMDYTADSNIPDGTVRWSATNKRFELWNASTLTWGVLSSQYLINVDQVDSEHASDFASAVGGSGARQAKDADTVDGVDLPGTIAQILTDHNKAAHNALGIDAGSLGGAGRAAFAERNAAVVFTDVTGNKFISTTTYPQVQVRASASNQATAVRLQDDALNNAAEFVAQTNDEVKIVQYKQSDGSVVQSLTFRTDGTMDHDSNEVYDQGNLFTSINDVTASRAKGTTYTNNTGRPMQWLIEMSGTGSNAMTVAGVTVAVARVTNTPCVIIPNGATYSLATAGAAITRWIEIS